MFDRFSGVKDKVRDRGLQLLGCLNPRSYPKASPEGTHFLVPWLQKAILYDCRIKPRVSWTISYDIRNLTWALPEHFHNNRFQGLADGLHYPACALTT